MDKGQSDLLKWAVENSDASKQNDSSQTSSAGQPPRGLSAEAVRSLMGGPSDADLMKDAMTIIVVPESSLESKMTAFDNFEQLVENMDNANNLEPLGLWQPLLAQLDNHEGELRKMAAWCVGTAVQNNVKAQEQLLKLDGVQMLANMAIKDPDQAARRKAVYALSSSVRNFQPGMDEALKCLPKNIAGPDHVSANDMDVIDAIMAKLRESE